MHDAQAAVRSGREEKEAPWGTPLGRVSENMQNQGDEAGLNAKMI